MNRNSSSRSFFTETELSEKTPILQRRQETCHKFSKRCQLALLCFLGFINVYAMRVNLSVGLVVMVNNTATGLDASGTSTATCPELLRGAEHGSEQEFRKSHNGQFNWDEETQARILGSFFYGYVITQLPGGILAAVFGAKWFFGIGVLFTSVFTLLTPIAAELGEGYLTGARIIEGLAEGVTFPAANVLIGRWVPTMERSRMSTLIFSGSSVGTVLAMGLSGILADSDFFGGWPSIFYFFGAIGCFWFVIWSLLIYEHPSQHPSITESELEYVQQHHSDNSKVSVPWCKIFSSGPLWALAITHFGQNWGFYTLLTEMPKYFATVLHFDIKKNGLLSSLPYILQALFAYMGSFIADGLRKSGRLSITTIRKIMNSVAFYVPAICFLLASYTGCYPAQMVTLFCVCSAFNGFFHSGFNVTHVDMSPTYAGMLMGVTNFISNTSGFLAPYLVGYILSSKQYETLQAWNFIFFITAIMYLGTGTIYNLFCTAELQPWDPSARNTRTDTVARPEESATSVMKVPPRT